MPFAAVGAALGVSAGAVALGAASIATGIYSASQAGNAAQSQADAANNASAGQMAMFNKTQANLQPYVTEGNNSLRRLQDSVWGGQLGGKFTNADLNANMAPNYQFQLEQGQQALQNSQSAQDGVLSGAAMKGMQNFTQNTAAGAYQNAYNNWLSTQNYQYNALSNVASLGENAAASLGNTGASVAQSVGNNTIGAGNAQAAGQIAGANALGGGFSNAGGYYQMNSLLNPTTGSPSSAVLDTSGGGYTGGLTSGSNAFMSGGAYGFGGVSG